MREIAKEIIEKAAYGDMPAFEEIYKTFSSAVYSIALGVVRNRHDADEVTQDVFVKIFRSIKSFRFSSSFGTWVYRIAMNTSINSYKALAKRSLRNTSLDEFGEALLKTDSGRAGDLRDRLGAKSKVYELLGCLSPKHRSCIVLREIEGLDYKDMANVMGIPINTVRSRLKRARQALVAYCKREGVSHEM